MALREFRLIDELGVIDEDVPVVAEGCRSGSHDFQTACETTRIVSHAGYWQLGNLKLPILVLQLNVPLALRYSFVYQNVQSSAGSTVMAL